MPSPIPVERFLPRDLSPSIDLRPCSSPLELSRSKPRAFLPAAGSRRLGVLPPRLAWCSIDWEQVRVLEPLGSGGFGSVYRATYCGQTVALKKVKRCSKNRLASRQSFWGELNAACLRHPHVVRVVAASACCPGEPGSPGTIIMEYAGSSTLHQRIYGRGPPLGRERCVRYARHIADGLGFLHREKVVHLDLKPANVLLAPRDLCKIGDFGCSQRLRDGEEDPCSTLLRHLGGTYTHRAPELLRGDPVTVKADMYSYAVTVWQMVTRELPYTGDRQCVLYAVVAYDLRPEIGQVFSDTEAGRALGGIIQSCWVPRPEERPSAEAVLHSLQAEDCSSASSVLPPGRDCSSASSVLPPGRDCSSASSVLPPGRDCSSASSVLPPGRDCSSASSVLPPGRDCSSASSVLPPGRDCSSASSVLPPGRDCSSASSVLPPGRDCSSASSVLPPGRDCSSASSVLPPGRDCSSASSALPPGRDCSSASSVLPPGRDCSQDPPEASSYT
ncbi:proto-oncogene serine/threonine-protein kinase mos [Ranitomeya imitator]|uniref:proto-oncogene serine/threonine-protein kinase mos n=1 Tax=Ranitomeya imitator TaxID=111125 RepID=UPI0037E73906